MCRVFTPCPPEWRNDRKKNRKEKTYYVQRFPYANSSWFLFCSVRGEGAIHALLAAISIGRAISRIRRSSCDTTETKQILQDCQDKILERGSEAVRASRGVYFPEKQKATVSGPRMAWGHPSRPIPVETITLQPQIWYSNCYTDRRAMSRTIFIERPRFTSFVTFHSRLYAGQISCNKIEDSK